MKIYDLKMALAHGNIPKYIPKYIPDFYQPIETEPPVSRYQVEAGSEAKFVARLKDIPRTSEVQFNLTSILPEDFEDVR